jgi:hypothetical protein
MVLRDELIALRDATAQSYAHAEHLKHQWTEIDRAQAGLYQVRWHTVMSTFYLYSFPSYAPHLSTRGSSGPLCVEDWLTE